MILRELRRRLVSRPAWGTAAVALVLRVLLVHHAWQTNSLVRDQILDGEYYLRWAREIASGDVLGTRGICAGEPWLFNPLYAYVLAPVTALFDHPVQAIVYAQAVLGAATAALAAAAAVRTFGRAAGWTAGLLVAFATPLAQLDAHVAVTELAAFLVAGACFACSPATPGDRPAAHGPVAAGLWLGLAALARPVTPLALPLVAWRFARGSGRPLRSAALVVAAFAATALPPLARNWAVSGEPTVYTASGGINAYLGNNSDARAWRVMSAASFRFHPEWMHVDAKAEATAALGREPTRGEISSWYWRRTWSDVVDDPAGAALFLLHKARWFFSAVEVPSSASLRVDLEFSPGLALAFVPAWLVAALAVAGAWAWRQREDVLCGPGAIAVAHWAMLTLVFPLSHYRAPAIPALAVLAGGAVAAAFAAGAGDRWLRVAVVAAVAAVVGALPQAPDPLVSRDELNLGGRALADGDLAGAERHARAAVDEKWNAAIGNPLAWQLLGDTLLRQRRWKEAKDALDRAVDLSPGEDPPLLMRSYVCEMLDDTPTSERDARTVAGRSPHLAAGFIRLGEILSWDPRRPEEARDMLRRGMDLGGTANPEAMKRAGLDPEAPR